MESPALTRHTKVYFTNVLNGIKQYYGIMPPLEKIIHFTDLLHTYLKHKDCTLELVKVLHLGGANIGKGDDETCSLSLAIEYGHNEITQYLIEKGAAKDYALMNTLYCTTTLTAKSPLQMAIRKGNTAVALQVIDYQRRTDIPFSFYLAMDNKVFAVALRLYIMHRHWYLKDFFKQKVFSDKLAIYFTVTNIALHNNDKAFVDLYEFLKIDGYVKEVESTPPLCSLFEIARKNVRKHLLLVAGADFSAPNVLLLQQLPPTFEKRCDLLYRSGLLPQDCLPANWRMTTTPATSA